MKLQMIFPVLAGIALIFSAVLFAQKSAAINTYFSNGSARSAGDSIRPFEVKIPKEALIELRRRLAETRALPLPVRFLWA